MMAGHVHGIIAVGAVETTVGGPASVGGWSSLTAWLLRLGPGSTSGELRSTNVHQGVTFPKGRGGSPGPEYLRMNGEESKKGLVNHLG
jgi:hypothetical protein